MDNNEGINSFTNEWYMQVGLKIVFTYFIACLTAWWIAIALSWFYSIR